MKFLFFLFFIFFVLHVQAQVYIPIDTIHSQRKELAKHFQVGTKELEREFRSYPVTNRKLIRNFVDSRNKMFSELMENQYFFLDPELESYLNGLLLEIAEINKIGTQSLRIFLSRDTAPNAFSLGDGNFVFNLSLLNRLENEDELRFIIAHELAHYQLDHLKKRMEIQMRLASSKDYVSKQKKIKRSRYNKFSKSLEYYLDMIYESHAEGRRRELEADSMGFIMIKNLVADPYHTISALEKQDTLSPSEIYKIDIEMLRNHFSTPNMSFKEEWLAGYDFSKYNYQRGKVDVFGIHKDSLLSHPEMKERVSNLKKSMLNNVKSKREGIDRFQKLKEKIRYEDVYAHYCMEEYGRGIYLIIQLQNSRDVDKNEGQFYTKMLSLFYEKLREARLSFTFKKYVDDVNVVFYSEEYNLFLTILDNLRASELQELTLIK